MNEYKCNKCGLFKVKEKFTTSVSYKDGIRKTCKQCAAKRQKQYWLNNPDQYAKHKARVKENDKVLKRVFTRHGLSEEEYMVMFKKCNGLCWSCKDRPANNIDHDHNCCKGTYSCGKCVRGVLCSQCNTALGLLKDDSDVIKNLLAYSLMVKR